MNSLQNYEPTLSKQHETKVFERFGMKFHVNVLNTQVEEWEPYIVENPDGTASQVQDWRKTGQVITTSEVVSALIQDNNHCREGKPIYLYATADGPILAICLEKHEDHLVLLDPCAVVFDGKSRLNLRPIFGVSRKLNVHPISVRSHMPPVEVLLAAYPGFLVQNRMFKYQLRPNIPFVTTPELTNDGT